MRGLLPGVVVCCILLVIYGTTMLPDLGWEDTPEIALAIESLGIPHSPGFPLVILTGRSIQAMTGASGARSATILSALGVIISCTYIAGIFSRSSPILGIAAGISLGLAPAVWFQATRGEVYGLHLFFATALMTIHMRKPSIRTGFISGYLLALGVLTHPSLLLLGIPLMATKRPRLLAMMVCGSILGFSMVAYLPLRSAHDPFLDWGNPETVENVFWMLSLREFATDFSAGTLRSHPDIPSAVGEIGSYISDALSPALWGLACVGAMTGIRRMWRFITAGICVATFAVLGGRGPDFDAYLLPLIPLTIIFAMEASTRLTIRKSVIAGAWLLSLVIILYPDLDRFDRSEDVSAVQYQASFAEEMQGSILFTDNTPDLFLLLHQFHAEGGIPWVVYTPYLEHEWYRSSLPAPLNRLLPDHADPEFTVVEEIARRSARRALYSFSELPRGTLGILVPEGWGFHASAYHPGIDEQFISRWPRYSCGRGTPGAHHLAVRLGQGGQLLSASAEYTHAADRLAAALQFDPDNPALWLGLSHSYMGQRKWSRALRAVRAMVTVPDLDRSLVIMAAETAESILRRKPETAVDGFIDSLARSRPHEPILHAHALRSALIMKLPGTAMERAHRYRGEVTGEILNLSGTAHLLSGDFATAETVLRSALNAEADRRTRERIAANLILCLRYLGDVNGADSVAHVFGLGTR